MQKEKYIATYEVLLTELIPLPNKRPLLIAVDGRPCSGKTTLTAQLEKSLQAQVMYLDEFFIPQRQWPQDRTPIFPFFYFRYHEFLDGVKALAAGKKFRYRTYDWQIDDISMQEKCIDPSQVVIIEGVSALNQEIASVYFKKIWVASDQDTELEEIKKREHGNNLDLWMNIYLPSVDLYCLQKPWLWADIVYAGRGLSHGETD